MMNIAAGASIAPVFLPNVPAFSMENELRAISCAALGADPLRAATAGGQALCAQGRTRACKHRAERKGH